MALLEQFETDDQEQKETPSKFPFARMTRSTRTSKPGGEEPLRFYCPQY
jgi:hypothetical protein